MDYTKRAEKDSIEWHIRQRTGGKKKVAKKTSSRGPGATRGRGGSRTAGRGGVGGRTGVVGDRSKPPPGYVCSICSQRGHLVQNCTKNSFTNKKAQEIASQPKPSAPVAAAKSDAPDLSDWFENWDEEGNKYYENPKLGLTQWEAPKGWESWVASQAGAQK